MKAWRIELFGGVRVFKCVNEGDRESWQPVRSQFTTRQTGALLAYLAYHREACSAESLMEMIWADASRDPRNSLQVALTTLRDVFEAGRQTNKAVRGSVIQRHNDSYQLNSNSVAVDVRKFDELLHTAEKSVDAKAIQCFQEAAALYRGPLMKGYENCLDEAGWLDARRLTYEENYLKALRHLGALLEKHGDFEQALDCAQLRINTDAQAEDPHCDYMRLLALSGQRDAAFRYIGTLQDIGRASGRGLSQDALALIERFKAGEIPAIRTPQEREQISLGIRGSESSTENTEKVAVPGLPVFSTKFFGREQEIDHLTNLLTTTETKLITLTGAGGAGKTRLAIEAAKCAARQFPNGIHFAALAEIVNADQFLPALADLLAVPRPSSEMPWQGVADALAKNSLLILDNFEQLGRPGTQQVETLLEYAPNLTCLVTSQKALELPGEKEMKVNPLPTPVLSDDLERLGEFDCVRIFSARAQAVKPSFRLTIANAQSITELCRRLEGIPLEIELAAGHAASLEPAQMIEGLAHRFDTLVHRGRVEDPVRRHQSLLETVAWSYRLLPPDLQRFFVRLSVFRAGWTEEAARSVCKEPLARHYLPELEKRSLIFSEIMGEERRYFLRETMREFGTSLLTSQEQEEISRSHAQYFCDLSDQTWLQRTGVHQSASLEQLEAEHQNLNTALDWCLDQSPKRTSTDVNIALHMVCRLWEFWNTRSYCREGRQWLDEVLLQMYTSAPAADRAEAFNGAGVLAVQQQDYDKAKRMLGKSLKISSESHDWKAIGHALNSLGYWALLQPNPSVSEIAINYYYEAWQAYHNAGAKRNTLWPLHGMGKIALQRHDYEIAQALFEAAVDIGERYNYDIGLVQARLSLVNLLQEQREPRKESGTKLLLLLKQSLQPFQQLKDSGGIASCLESYGGYAAAGGRWPDALRLWAAAQRIRLNKEARLQDSAQTFNDSRKEQAFQALGQERYEQEWDAGLAMDQEEAIAFALALRDHLP